MQGFKVLISGGYACFTRLELKVERVSYDVITPGAARGILEAVFWKPAIRYVIDEIAVCKPIRFENIRRNEVSSKASARVPYIATSEDRTQRMAMVLRDVQYIITAHFEPVSDKCNLNGGDRDTLPNGSFNHGKFAEIIRRRLQKGQCFHHPYLGTREFPADVKLIEESDELPVSINESRSLGLMPYDTDYEKDEGNIIRQTPIYFRAEIKNGIIDLRNVEALK
ncbi:MAG: type I-C CRISPR-associated protein Cas5c [Coriobacteriales bacterium]|jgi:CRISPR-associated protein Cas5d|nr:type I-C CRISPR-associated protein Cas5c [Coriobacteriales bacterium]